MSYCEHYQEAKVSYERLLTVERSAQNVYSLAKLLHYHLNKPEYATILYKLTLELDAEFDMACMQLGSFFNNVFFFVWTDNNKKTR